MQIKGKDSRNTIPFSYINCGGTFKNPSGAHFFMRTKGGGLNAVNLETGEMVSLGDTYEVIKANIRAEEF